MIRDHAAARESVERILLWDFDLVIAHGDVLESDGRERVHAAFLLIGAILSIFFTRKRIFSSSWKKQRMMDCRGPTGD